MKSVVSNTITTFLALWSILVAKNASSSVCFAFVVPKTAHVTATHHSSNNVPAAAAAHHRQQCQLSMTTTPPPAANEFLLELDYDNYDDDELFTGTATTSSRSRGVFSQVSNVLAPRHKVGFVLSKIATFITGLGAFVADGIAAETEMEIAELPPPYVPAIFGVVLLAGVGILTSSLGDVMDEEASLGLQSGARAKKEIERSRSSYFKKRS